MKAITWCKRGAYDQQASIVCAFQEDGREIAWVCTYKNGDIMACLVDSHHQALFIDEKSGKDWVHRMLGVE